MILKDCMDYEKATQWFSMTGKPESIILHWFQVKGLFAMIILCKKKL